MATLSTTALCSVQLVKDILKKSDSGDDAIITTLINSVSVWVETYCDRLFSQATRTEYYDGDGLSELFVRQYPVTAITSIHNDPNSPPDYDAAYLEDSDYYGIKTDTDGLIYFRNSSLYKGTENIKVIYTAGYDRGSAIGASDDTLPEDLQLAVARHVARLWKEVGGPVLGHISKTSSGGGATKYLKTIEPMDQEVFDRYKKQDPV